MAREELASAVLIRMKELGLQQDPIDSLAKVVSGIDSEVESYTVDKDGKKRLVSVKVTRTQTSMAAGARLFDRLSGGALGIGGNANAPKQIGKDFFDEFAPEVDEAIIHRDLRRSEDTE